MIYPKKINAKKSDVIIRSLILASILLGIIFVLINKITTPNIPWAALTNSGIIYVWLIVIYSVKKRINIAGHSLLQLFAISILTLYIDYRIGFRGWSIEISIPIIIMIANIVMFILTIISYKKYIKYGFCQLIIVLFSMLPLIFIVNNSLKNEVLSIIAVSISIINLIFALIFASTDIKEAVVRRFHI